MRRKCIHRAFCLHRSFTTRSEKQLWSNTSGPLHTEHLHFTSTLNTSEPKKLAIILHGLLGAGKNLRSFSERLLRHQLSGSDWTAVLVDLRCHGKSSQNKNILPPHTLQTAAEDVIQTIRNSWHGDNNHIDLLVGHSLGGKISLEIGKQLQASTSNHDRPPKQIWVLDSMIHSIDQQSNTTASEVHNVLNTVRGIPLPIPSREWLYDYLEKKGFSKGLQLWLGSGLIPIRKQEYVWTTDLDGAMSLFQEYMHTNSWSYIEDPTRESDVHVVQAEKSDRWDKSSLAKLHAAITAREDNSGSGKTYKHVLKGAGHWVHVDNPQGLVDIMTPFLKD